MGQLLQRLLLALPPTGARTSSQLRTFSRLVALFADADDLAVSASVMEQFQVLRKAFFCIEAAYKEASNNQPLARESLESVEVIQRASENCTLTLLPS